MCCYAIDEDGSSSRMRTEAQKLPKEKATTILDLEGKTDDEVQYHILHEFGHVLGLYHENQHPQYLKVMDEFLDEKKMKNLSGISNFRNYRLQYRSLDAVTFRTDYDEGSIMHYP